ncbi:kama family protein [Polychaeton citri CBS 116435]|uniref:Kama family protein n=1 Tax=Polychaeton citri CBS 116435 TaxID=1314669 RepID=A0A9P4UK03_9PEZI|nr:kama family protein [Polychaeton citri CBS 116435]
MTPRTKGKTERVLAESPKAVTTSEPELHGELGTAAGPVLAKPQLQQGLETLEHPLTDQQILEGPYWQTIERWQSATEQDFLSYRWQIANTIDRKDKLFSFLKEVLPETLPRVADGDDTMLEPMSQEEFLENLVDGLKAAPMAVRLTPHVLSLVNWNDPMNDPICRQFIPLRSILKKDHSALAFDSLHEEKHSPLPGLVHRYPDRVLFLATSVCPVYCRFCTRSYAIGADTERVSKKSLKPTRRRWDPMFEYIEQHPEIQDVVVSGGDAYYLTADQLRRIGDRLLSIPHIKRFRFATKGLGVCPSRFVDPTPNDGWAQVLVDISSKARQIGKQVAVHTHINHPREMTWITERAARFLFSNGVIVRNQSVLLRGVNDSVDTMSTLIRRLADFNFQPYYVYQADLVKGVEDFRTPLSTIIELEKKIRGTIAGFMMPSFVVDLPGGGGKRLATSYESYDEQTGISTWKAPGVSQGEEFFYFDPKAES